MAKLKMNLTRFLTLIIASLTGVASTDAIAQDDPKPKAAGEKAAKKASGQLSAGAIAAAVAAAAAIAAISDDDDKAPAPAPTPVLELTAEPMPKALPEVQQAETAATVQDAGHEETDEEEEAEPDGTRRAEEVEADKGDAQEYSDDEDDDRKSKKKKKKSKKRARGSDAWAEPIALPGL